MKWKELFCVETAPLPGIIVIFGATGDLARRKLFPALQDLYSRKLLNEDSQIIACGRRSFDDDSFRDMLGGRADFLNHICYCCGDNNSDELYNKLKLLLQKFERRATGLAGCNELFYLALAPDDMLTVCRKLAEHDLLTEEKNTTNWKHVVLEKPFGRDLESALQLNAQLTRHLDEKQICRIDHYLGKETVQNILMMRFANVIFEPLWRAEYIEHVEITAAESLGIEQRGKYYDQTGALRDMMQNHLLQLLSLVAMEVPASFGGDDIQYEKIKLLRAVRPLQAKNVVRGQYCGYRQEKDVAAASQTETYVAAKLFIDNWRWLNVPFYLRTGKSLGQKKSQVILFFKNIPHSIFPDVPPEELPGNELIFNISPQEGVALTLQAKKPGPKLCIGQLELALEHRAQLKTSGDDAYARLLLDALLGDHTLFIRSDFIEEAWKLLTPVLEYWQQDCEALELYPVGSDGPTGSEQLIAPSVWSPLAPAENRQPEPGD